MGPKTNDTALELWNLFPNEINGWLATEDRIYDPDTIFEYLNGSGEVYRAFNFEKLFARRFVKECQPKIIADLFDMATDKDAFGIFSHGYEGNDVGIGQGSNYMDGLLSFWKDRFFISLFAEAETDEAREALFKLAREMDSAIEKEGQIPEIISFLPPEGLDRDRVRYFHNHIILNHHFFLADENILFLDQKTDCALGIYLEQEEEYCLLLIRYTGPDLAAKALESFADTYMPDASEPGIVQTEGGMWTAARQEGDLLIIVFDASSKSHALAVRGRVSTFDI
jgi:hypothetical protein